MLQDNDDDDGGSGHNNNKDDANIIFERHPKYYAVRHKKINLPKVS